MDDYNQAVAKGAEAWKSWREVNILNSPNINQMLYNIETNSILSLLCQVI